MDSKPENSSNLAVFQFPTREVSAKKVISTKTIQEKLDIDHKGSRDLIDKYLINDKAYSDTSKKNFIKTVSSFHHAK